MGQRPSGPDDTTSVASAMEKRVHAALLTVTSATFQKG